MDDIKIIFTSTQMELFIKDLLSLNKGGKWSRHTMDSKIIIKTKADDKELQKAIYDWLNKPERKLYFGG